MNHQEIISIYESVAFITHQMVGAAENHNWALLAKLEESCQLQMQVIKDNKVTSALMDEERKMKVDVIKKILADDRKIRDIIEPRMAQLSKLMRGANTQNKVFRAYQTDHG